MEAVNAFDDILNHWEKQGGKVLYDVYEDEYTQDQMAVEFLGSVLDGGGATHAEVNRWLLKDADRRRWFLKPKKRTGLSTSHIFSQSYLKPYQPAHVTLWDGGSLAKVERGKTPFVWKPTSIPKRSAGDIKSFSEDSRRRILRTLGKIKSEQLPLFVTLTYPDHFPQEPEEWKRHLKNFAMRFGREFHAGCFLWRLEIKHRLSGENEGKLAPHFHLLVWGGGYRRMLSWLSQAWYEACGELSAAHLRAGTSVERIRSRKGTFFYASKYITKTEQEDIQLTYGSVGRWWGIYHRANVPWAREIDIELTEKEANDLLRYLRKKAGLKGRHYQSLTVFVDAASWWLDHLENILHPY